MGPTPHGPITPKVPNYFTFQFPLSQLQFKILLTTPPTLSETPKP